MKKKKNKKKIKKKNEKKQNKKSKTKQKIKKNIYIFLKVGAKKICINRDKNCKSMKK